MKKRFKASHLFTIVGVITSFVSTGSVLATEDRLASPTYVNRKEQCYQFNAETQPANCGSPKYSTWVIEYDKKECDIKVYAMYLPDRNPTCIEAKNAEGKNLIDDPVPLKDIALYVPSREEKKVKYLTGAFAPNSAPSSKCIEMWLRFADDENCNARCFTSGGNAYCR